jgi:hypothetical protein
MTLQHRFETPRFRAMKPKIAITEVHSGQRLVRCGQGKRCSAGCGVRGKGVGVLGCEVSKARKC